MAATNDQPASDVLRLEVCPGCAYLLAGLPAEGACPECGRVYDRQSVVLYGWNWRLTAPVLFASFNLLMLSANQGLHPAGRLVLIGGLIALATAAVAQRLTIRHPAPIYVWLGPEGCAEYDLRGDLLPKWAPFAICCATVFVALLLSDFGMIFIGSVAIGIMVVLCIDAIAKNRRLRRGPPVLPSQVRVSFAEWSEIAAVTIERGWRARAYRLRIRKHRHCWWGSDPVDAEILCSDAQVEPLRKCIEEWIARANAPAANA